MTQPLPLSDAELLRKLRAAVEALPDAPLALQQSAFDLWPAPAPAPAPATPLRAAARALWNHVVATLAFDSGAAPTLAHGMRSAGTPARHLLFTADGRDIDLRIKPAGGAFELTGQILGPDERGTLELVAEDDAGGDAGGTAGGGAAFARLAELDELGEFRLVDVAPGRYRMTLRIGADQIVLPRLAIGPASP